MQGRTQRWYSRRNSDTAFDRDCTSCRHMRPRMSGSKHCIHRVCSTHDSRSAEFRPGPRIARPHLLRPVPRSVGSDWHRARSTRRRLHRASRCSRTTGRPTCRRWHRYDGRRSHRRHRAQPATTGQASSREGTRASAACTDGVPHLTANHARPVPRKTSCRVPAVDVYKHHPWYPPLLLASRTRMGQPPVENIPRHLQPRASVPRHPDSRNHPRRR